MLREASAPQLYDVYDQMADNLRTLEPYLKTGDAPAEALKHLRIAQTALRRFGRHLHADALAAEHRRGLPT